MSKFNPVFVDILCFIIGPALIAYNLFDFSIGKIPLLVLDGDYDKQKIYYYYKQDTQYVIAFGVALVCWGFLRIYWKKNEGINK